MYISFDDGASWNPFQMNLPLVPITDLAIKDDNLIAATQGRSIWLIDDLTPLHQVNKEVAQSDHYLYQPMNSYRMGGGGRSGGRPSKTEGQNHPGGVMVHFYLKEQPDPKTEISLTFLQEDGTEIKTFSTKATEKSLKLKDLTAGANRFILEYALSRSRKSGRHDPNGLRKAEAPKRYPAGIR